MKWLYEWFFEGGPDDPMYWTIQGMAISGMFVLAVVMFWMTGFLIFHGNKEVYWPGLITSGVWIAVGGMGFAAIVWILWMFGKALNHIAKGFGE